jgi:propanol-preferring alcohol dehydrogenase
MKMRAARMHDYRQPLVLDEVPAPEPGPAEVRLKVAATGMCRSDWQLLDGYFKPGITLTFPYIPGHEIAGHVDRIGGDVPQGAGLSEGDLVVVDAGWGDGSCRQCHEGNEQLCSAAGRPWSRSPRSDEKLAVAAKHGADHIINTRDKTADQVQAELARLTGRSTIDAIRRRVQAVQPAMRAGSGSRLTVSPRTTGFTVPASSVAAAARRKFDSGSRNTV